MNSSRFVIVLGAPRSGTTLLAATLSCHSEIAILNEDRWGSCFKLLSKEVRGVKLCIPNGIDLNHGKMDQLFMYVRYVLGEHIVNSARGWLGLKQPERSLRSTLSIREYEERAGSMNVVGIVREPADVIASIQKRGNQSFRRARHRWERAVHVLYELWEEREDAGTMSVVSFSRLVSKPAECLRAVLGELGLRYEEDVLEGYRYTPQYPDREGIDADKANRNQVPAAKDAVNQQVLKQYITLREAAAGPTDQPGSQPD